MSRDLKGLKEAVVWIIGTRYSGRSGHTRVFEEYHKGLLCSQSRVGKGKKSGRGRGAGKVSDRGTL